MIQRESPVTDPVAGLDPAVSTLVPSRSQLLDPTACRAIGLPHVPRRPLSIGSLSIKTLLSSLQSGQAIDLASFDPVECGECELAPRHRAAIVQALSSPDLFLMQGGPGTGKSSVAAELLHQAARRGLRVLFLAATAAGVDRVLEMLAGHADFAAVRSLASDESLASLPECVRPMTLAERVRSFEEDTLAATRHRTLALRTQLAEQAPLEAVLTDLEAMPRRYDDLTSQLEPLHARRDGLPMNLDGPTAPEELTEPWERLCHIRQEIARQKHDLVEQVNQCQEREQANRAELDTLKPLLEARDAGRWWSPSFWRGKGDVRTQAASLEQTCQELHATAQRAQQNADQMQAQLHEQTQSLTAALDRLRTELNEKIALREAEQTALRERWGEVIARLPETVRPTEFTSAAIASSRAKLAAHTATLQSDLASAEQTMQALESARVGLPERLAATVPVVASTLGSLRSDPHFGDGTAPFDLLVLDEADQVTEADFLSVAERAARWVLLGEPTRYPDAPRRNAVARSQRPAHLRPGFFQRLFARLHDDPSARRVAWRADLEQLVCVLDRVPPEQERWIQPEPVVDRPDITLHIFAPPRQSPRLVEVEFTAGTAIDDAKAFVFRELDELPLQSRARCITWEQTAERIVARFGGDLPGKSKLVTLGEGVTEVVNLLSGHWHTARLEFDPASGWTPERAVAWLRKHLQLTGQDRTAFLDRPLRHSAALASWLADLLDEPRFGSPASEPCVEFVTVPSLSDDRPGRRFDSGSRNGGGVATLAPRLKSLRGGAGVEIHLAEPRRHDLLPPELREVLPEQGLVNYLEARAVVRLVRELIDEPASRQEILQWQKELPACATGDRCKPLTHHQRRPGIAVMALHPAQVLLIRHLLKSVTPGDIRVEVDVPEHFRHRECAVAVVALTRSHSHRAVAYGDSPAQLLLALTRPARQLILVGDPGTLLRRSQYTEAVDHLDDTESEQEMVLAGRLVRYLQGHGSQQRAFTIRELAGL